MEDEVGALCGPGVRYISRRNWHLVSIFLVLLSVITTRTSCSGDKQINVQSVSNLTDAISQETLNVCFSIKRLVELLLPLPPPPDGMLVHYRVYAGDCE